jgi:hypothetical protein
MKKTRIPKVDEVDFNKPINQEQFGLMMGIPQQTVSKLVQYSVLSPGGSVKTWIQQYIRFQFGRIFATRGWRGLAIATGEGAPNGYDGDYHEDNKEF